VYPEQPSGERSTLDRVIRPYREPGTRGDSAATLAVRWMSGSFTTSECGMQLIPLSCDGRVTAVGGRVSVPGPVRVALVPGDDGVTVVALGHGIPRPVGRLGASDAGAYAPLLRSLRAEGLIGTCGAQMTPAGMLVLHLAPAPECVLSNSPGDLVLLAADRSVTVTREERHQDVLAGRCGRVAVALAPGPITSGKYAGQRGIEVRLDGRRVGELTRLMSQRYLPMVDEVVARGGRAGCEALLRPDHRGIQVELRLPAVDATVGHANAAKVAAPSPSVPTTVAPVPPSHPPSLPVRGPRPDRGRRRTVIAGVATVGVLIFAAVVGNGARNDAPTPTSTASDATSALARSVTSADSTAAIPTSTIPSTTTTGSAKRSTAPANTATATRTRPGTSKPSPKPAPQPEPAPEPTGSGCDPNYSGCVPIASDVDCAGGTGNGPAYVKGPVHVVKTDIYGLDADHDGTACE
jgi:hypothetical protein